MRFASVGSWMAKARNDQASVPIGSRFTTKTCLLNAVQNYQEAMIILSLSHWSFYNTASHCIQAVKATAAAIRNNRSVDHRSARAAGL